MSEGSGDHSQRRFCQLYYDGTIYQKDPAIPRLTRTRSNDHEGTSQGRKRTVTL